MNFFPILISVSPRQRLLRHRQHVKEVSNGENYCATQAQWYLLNKVYGHQGYLDLSARLSGTNIKNTGLNGELYIEIADVHAQLTALLEGITLKCTSTSELSRNVIDRVIAQLTLKREAKNVFSDLISEIKKLARLTPGELKQLVCSTSNQKNNLQQMIHEAILATGQI